MIDYRVYLVTDDPSRYAGNWIDAVVAAVEGGVTCVQYRDTENVRQVQFERIRQLQDAIRRFGVPLVVNNDAELAAAVKSEGVHVGQNDMPVAEVRRIVGGDCEIGLSITNEENAEALLGAPFRGEVNCVGIGPVFDATKTKRDASAALGTARLSAIAKRLGEFANCAIGGINLENAAEVMAAGAKGLAVVSAFSQAEDPFSVAKRICEAAGTPPPQREVR